MPIYLSMFVCSLIFAAAKRRATSRQKRAPRLRVYTIYFPVHCAGVTNISPRYNLSPAVKLCRRHWHMRSSSTIATKKNYRLVIFRTVVSANSFHSWLEFINSINFNHSVVPYVGISLATRFSSCPCENLVEILQTPIFTQSRVDRSVSHFETQLWMLCTFLDFG